VKKALFVSEIVNFQKKKEIERSERNVDGAHRADMERSKENAWKSKRGTRHRRLSSTLSVTTRDYINFLNQANNPRMHL
jgi:hypothetical protein